MQIRVGITTSDLTTLNHKKLSITSDKEIRAFRFECKTSPASDADGAFQSGVPVGLASKALVQAKVTGGVVEVSGQQLQQGERLLLTSASALKVTSLHRANGTAGGSPSYNGKLEIFVDSGNNLRLVLITTLEEYVKGVLQSEIPASYGLEAIKAQAVAARTYALNPRISHENDASNVCDSYLCCQYFAGSIAISEKHKRAIDATAGKVLTFADRPILALFSSCAGGHTENFEACFSDPVSGKFPMAPLPYLRGVAEGKVPPNPGTENYLRAMWQMPKPATADAWSPHFKWSATLTGNQIESQMHHVIQTLQKDSTVAPFIVAPKSGKFGHVKTFEVNERGIAGTAITLRIATSTGDWYIKKELVIRSVFKNSEAKISRLKSARMYFDLSTDRLGLLSLVTIRGLGWGHGVGMQQTGAQGFAKQGHSYQQILNHYFQGAVIASV